MAERRQPRAQKREIPTQDSAQDSPKGLVKDLALICGPSEDGQGFRVLRRRAESNVVEAGTLRPLQEGRAITGEVVHLEPREEAPFLFDCETDEELSTPRPKDQAGPPRVASDQYRRGWDAIWGQRPRPAALN
jgi:hypothetical protein